MSIMRRLDDLLEIRLEIILALINSVLDVLADFVQATHDVHAGIWVALWGGFEESEGGLE
jgi:hypothetical protein